MMYQELILLVKLDYKLVIKLTVKPQKEVNELLKKAGTSELTTGTKMSELLKRTEINYDMLETIDQERPILTKQEKEEVEIQIKYEGYIKLQEEQVEKFKKLETKLLPENLDYETLKGISLEAGYRKTAVPRPFCRRATYSRHPHHNQRPTDKSIVCKVGLRYRQSFVANVYSRNERHGEEHGWWCVPSDNGIKTVGFKKVK